MQLVYYNITMKITVFGATGATGKKVVKQALELGYEVKAFVRNPEKMDITNDKLTLVKGDVINPEEVDRAVADTEGVIVALGASADMQSDIVMEKSAQNIISVMKKHGVKRIIIQSSYAMSGSVEGIEFMKSMGMGDEQIAMVKPVLDDKTKQEETIRTSGLEYTVVRPLMLTDEAKTGQYRVAEKLDVKVGDQISRADVADFMLKALTNDEWLNKTIDISY